MDGIIAYILSRKYAKSQGDSAKAYADEVGRRVEEAGFKAQVEQDRSILEGAGQVKILYLLPKESGNPKDGYDEYIYADNKWEWIGHTDIDLSAYATQQWVTQQLSVAQEIYTGNSAPTGTQTIWIDTSQNPTKVKFKIGNTWTDVVDIVTQGLPNADSMNF